MTLLPFSQLYLRPEALQDDCERGRVRLRAAFYKLVHESAHYDVQKWLELNSGTEFVTGTGWYYFFENADLRDVLDLVTAVCAVLKLRNYPRQGDWVLEVQRIFDEQRLKYVVDPTGSVRLRHDPEYEELRAAVIAGMDGARYRAALQAFEQAGSALSSLDPDTRGAVRAAFDALETVFKLMFPRAIRLGKKEIEENLRPLAQSLYAFEKTSQACAQQTITNLIAYVDASHQYRHAQGHEEPQPPGLELALVLSSVGAAHLRWLVHLDRAIQVRAGVTDPAP